MSEADPHVPENPPPGVGLYDLDGTLLPWDCQLVFRHFVVRREPWRVVFLPLFLLVAPLAAWLGAGRMKRVFLAYLWRMPERRLAELAREFAIALLPTVYPELLETMEAHRRRGDFLILASASPEIYVREIGRALEFDLTLGTPVRFGPLLPPLANHKGAAKVERLREVLPESWFHEGRIRACHGYTDSTADLPMLALCENATVVNPSEPLARLAAQNGWAIVRPERPWKTRGGFAWRALAMLCGLGRDPAGLTARSGRNPA